MEDKDQDPLFAIWGRIEKEFRLPPGFLGRVFKEDDWSFVIKAHALIEASVSHLLATKLGDSRLRTVFQRLDLSDNSKGKVAFAKSLEILTSEERRFIHDFSELRNSLVHQVENVGYSLSTYLVDLDPSKLKSRLKTMLYFTPDQSALEMWTVTAMKDPKLALWAGTTFLVTNCMVRASKAEGEQKHHKDRLGILDEIISGWQKLEP